MTGYCDDYVLYETEEGCTTCMRPHDYRVKSKAFSCEGNGLKNREEKATYDVSLYLDNLLLKYKCSRHG